MGKNNKKAGNEEERQIAKILSERFGADFRRTPLSGGFHLSYPGDIHNFGSTDTPLDNMIIEIKRRKQWAIKEWFDTLMKHCCRTFPTKKGLLIGRYTGDKRRYAIMTLEDFLSLFD